MGAIADRVEVHYSQRRTPEELFAAMPRIDVLVTTTALEAGIDIGGLDVCIVEGFPRLVARARQMFGRAGRNGEGAVVFAGDPSDPFDSYFLRNPEELFSSASPESVPVNDANEYLLAHHMCCAAHAGGSDFEREGPLAQADLRILGANATEVAAELVEQGRLAWSDGTLRHNGKMPHGDAPLDALRGLASITYSIVDRDGESLLERPEIYAFRDFHPSAIVTELARNRLHRVVELRDPLILGSHVRGPRTGAAGGGALVPRRGCRSGARGSGCGDLYEGGRDVQGKQERWKPKAGAE